MVALTLRAAPAALENATQMPATQQYHWFLCTLMVYFVLCI